jgi:signal transduction histidine kinase
MGVLAAGLAHEIKNPLSTMSLNLQLLEEDYSDPGSPQEERTLRRARLLLGEVKRLDGIVNDFLTLARGYEVTPSAVDLDLVVAELLRFHEAVHQRISVEARSAVAPEARFVVADPQLLRLALTNLLVNAQQAMAEGGGELLIETRARDHVVELRVTDTGPGIARDGVEKIWQPFFSTKQGGTGLGLPTTRRMVEEMGGEVRVVSELGRGTRFILSLPAVPKQLPPAETPS